MQQPDSNAPSEHLDTASIPLALNGQHPDTRADDIIRAAAQTQAAQQTARQTDEAILSVLTQFILVKNAVYADAGNIAQAMKPVRALLGTQLDAIKAGSTLEQYPTPFANAALEPEHEVHTTPSSDKRLTELTFHAVDFITIVAHAVRTAPQNWSLQLLSLMGCILPFIQEQHLLARQPADPQQQANPQIDASQVDYAAMAASIQLEHTQVRDRGAFYRFSATGHTGDANTQRFLRNSFPSELLNELEALYAKALGYWRDSRHAANRDLADRLYQPQQMFNLTEHSLLPWLSRPAEMLRLPATTQPKALRCFERIDSALLKQFQMLSWAIATKVLTADAQVFLENNEIFVESHDLSAEILSTSPGTQAQPHDSFVDLYDPSGKADEIDEQDRLNASQATVSHTAGAIKLTELVNESQFEIFVQHVTEIVLNTDTGETTHPHPDLTEQWRQIQPHAQANAEMHILSELGEYGRLAALTEALQTSSLKYVEMLITPSLDELFTRFRDEASSAPSGLFVIDALKQFSASHSPYLGTLAGLIFSLIMGQNTAAKTEATAYEASDHTQASVSDAGKAEATDFDVLEPWVDIDETAIYQTRGKHIANAISLDEALTKARALFVIALVTGFKEGSLGIKSLSQALYYLSFVNTGKPILGQPNQDTAFPQLTQNAINLLSRYLDEALTVTECPPFSHAIVDTLKSIYTNPALLNDANLSETRAATDTTAYDERETNKPSNHATASQRTPDPALLALINYFRSSSIDIADIELESFLGALVESELNKPITTVTEMVQRIDVVEEYLYAQCEKKITFEFMHADETFQTNTADQLPAEAKFLWLLSIVSTVVDACRPIDKLKAKLLLRSGIESVTVPHRFLDDLELFDGLLEEENSCPITLFDIACYFQHNEIIRRMITAPMATKLQQQMLTYTPKKRLPLLHLLCHYGAVRELRCLANKLIETQQTHALTTVASDQSTPLHIACAKGHADAARAMIQALLQTGQTSALVAKNALGQTPLHQACTSNNPDAVQVIATALIETQQLQALFAKSNTGQTPLHCAIRSTAGGGNSIASKMVQVMIEALSEAGLPQAFFAANRNKETPLHKACQVDNTQVAMLIAQALRDFGHPQALVLNNTSGQSPLHWACRNGRTETVKAMAKVLIETKQAQALATSDSEGMTPLHWAGRCGHTNTAITMIRILTKAKQAHALVATNAQKDTLLHYMLQESSDAVAQTLIQALIETRQSQTFETANTAGELPLHIACRKKHYQTAKWMVKFFIRTGQAERIFQKNSSGERPFRLIYARFGEPISKLKTRTEQYLKAHTTLLKLLHETLRNAVKRAFDIRDITDARLTQPQVELRTGISSPAATTAHSEQIEATRHVWEFLYDERQAYADSHTTFMLLIEQIRNVLQDESVSVTTQLLKNSLMRQISEACNLATPTHPQSQLRSGHTSPTLYQSGSSSEPTIEEFLESLECSIAEAINHPKQYIARHQDNCGSDKALDLSQTPGR